MHFLFKLDGGGVLFNALFSKFDHRKIQFCLAHRLDGEKMRENWKFRTFYSFLLFAVKMKWDECDQTHWHLSFLRLAFWLIKQMLGEEDASYASLVGEAKFILSLFSPFCF